MKTDFLYRKADYLGITGSVLCAIHCLVTPVLLMTSSVLKHDTLRFGYLSLDYIFIAVNIIAVFFATRHYGSPVIKRFLWGFLALFTVSILLEEVSKVFEFIGYMASAGLVVTHLFNLRQHRLSHAH